MYSPSGHPDVDEFVSSSSLNMYRQGYKTENQQKLEPNK